MELRPVQIVVQSWRILPSFPTSLSQRTALVGQPFREVSLEVIKVSEPTATYFNSLFKSRNKQQGREENEEESRSKKLGSMLLRL